MNSERTAKDFNKLGRLAEFISFFLGSMHGAEGDKQAASVQGVSVLQHSGVGPTFDFGGFRHVGGNVLRPSIPTVNSLNVDDVRVSSDREPERFDQSVGHVFAVDEDVEVRVPLALPKVEGNLTDSTAAFN